MTLKKLKNAEITQCLAKLNEQAKTPWLIESQKLTKTFLFKNFIEAFGFMSSAAIYAEKINHHPEWYNLYHQVKVQLSTHDIDGISDKDFDLAHMMNALY